MNDLPATGERFIPEKMNDPATMTEHYQRYNTALPLVKDKVVLDIASGAGYGTHFLSQSAREVYGVEIDQKAVDYSSEHYAKSNLHYLQGSVDHIPLEDHSVDVVISFETIEHVSAELQIRMMEEIRRVLKDDGILFISSPEKHYYSEERDYVNPYHVHELYESEFKALLEKYFSHIKYAGQRFLSGSFAVWDTDVSGKMVLYDGLTQTRSTEMKRPFYLLAIAGNQELPEVFNSVVESSPGSVVWQEQTNMIADLQNQLATAQNQLTMTRNQLTALQQQNLELLSSNFYRAFNKLHNIYLRLFPRETIHGRIVRKLVVFGILSYRGLKHGFNVSVNTNKDYSVKDPGKRSVKSFWNKKIVVPSFEKPRVSIIIPVYNQFAYTYFCIKSIVENAGDVPYEIIVADDCSTDKTKRIADCISNIKVCKTDRNVRFLLNCNHAAETAQGEFILFLNNDTFVHPDWLSSLVETMDHDPKAGIVGAKLVYANGALQEAGGIVFRDASAWNYGNGENPDVSDYNYLKECDYTSGASLMIRTTLWKEIGGFDERFVPAYYEDTDLCFEARRHGYKVIYQPKAVVTHFEGRSNGTDVSSGLKKYQVDNQKKFADKWKDVLAKHCNNGDNVFTARDRSSAKQHIFMLDHYVPTFDRDAGSRQMYCYVKILQNLGYMIHLLGDNRLHDEPYTSAFQQLGVEVLYGSEYGPNNLMKWFQDNSRFISYAFLNRYHIAVNYFPLIRQYPNIKLVYYGHDVGHIRLQRAFEVSGDQSLLPEIDLTKKQEMALYSSSDVNLCVGDFEYAYLKKAVPNIPLYNMPIFIYDRFIESFEPFENRKDLLFVGGFNHPPNKDGVLWFVKDILPSLIEHIPDIKFHIVGSNTPNEIRKLAGEHVIVDGFVSDEELNRLYRSCKVVVAPLRYGAGVKGKIIEALYNRSVVVTTAIGAEGIPSDNHPFAIADSPVDFANAVVNVYTDRNLWESYLRNSLAMIKSTYSYENAVKLMTEIFSKQH